jgi:hypothetical protein
MLQTVREVNGKGSRVDPMERNRAGAASGEAFKLSDPPPWRCCIAYVPLMIFRSGGLTP